jgi:hypothetical protein
MADAARDGAIDARPDAPPDAPRVCPTGYAAIAGGPAMSKYKVFAFSGPPAPDNSEAWLTAQSTCANDGTHLAYPDDASEATALDNAIATDPMSPYIWIGLTDAVTKGTWLTSLGATPPYVNWSGGSPPNGGTTHNCALMNNGTMYDWYCTTPYPFACECE